MLGQLKFIYLLEWGAYGLMSNLAGMFIVVLIFYRREKRLR